MGGDPKAAGKSADPSAEAPSSQEPVTRPFATTSAHPLRDNEFDDRYSMRTLLGRGGMADVFLTMDARIGREVALKAARSDSPDEPDNRFTREYRLQGRLEHPAIVPVYDVGTLPDGAPFFTMKRVRGDTLDDVLKRLADSDEATLARFTRSRLLSIFVTVAQSVHYAHARGVVHRDLKPANIMVGDFGEVYVLDWGIAKSIGDGSANDAAPISTRTPPVSSDSDLPDGATIEGALLGTPGYMAPEQLNDPSDVGPLADIYALGAIFFELLTYARLHPQERTLDVIESTMRGCEGRIRETCNARGIPPELEEICLRATKTRATDRYGASQDLVVAVQRFLDGDRDIEARAKLANEQADAALAALESIATSPQPSEARARALRHAGRTLALDPSHALAQEVLVRLLVDAPESEPLPAEVEAKVEQVAVRIYRRGAAAGAFLFSTWIPFIVWLFLSRPLDPLALGAWAALTLVAIAGLFWNAVGKERHAHRYFLTLAACLVSTLVATRVLGPHVSIPGILTLTVLGFLLLAKRDWQYVTAIAGAAAVVVPIVLEVFGVVSPTTVFDAEGMHVRSDVVRLGPTATQVTLALGNLSMFVLVCFAGRYIHNELVGNARRNALQSWKLASLVPGDRIIVPSPPSSSLWRKS
ncbi:MAG: serine/threonine protein kinase [Polyangiaceae bacterium]|nr:serine/threonine protein kinase [Polyangiaceae bacterium]